MNIWFPNTVCAAIFSWGLVTFARQQPNPGLALAVATYVIILVGMGYTRQSAALGFVMLALTQFSRGAIIRMAISLALAVSFHNSAVIMVLIVGLAVAKRGLGTMIMVALLGAFVVYQVSGGIIHLITTYTTFTATAAGAVPRMMLNVIPAAIFLALGGRLTTNRAERGLWTIFAILAFASMFLLFFVSSSLIADRLALYLNPLQMYVLSRLPAVLGTRTQQNMLMLSLILAYSLMVAVVWLRFGDWAHAWLPYRNYLVETVTTRDPPRWFRRVQ